MDHDFDQNEEEDSDDDSKSDKRFPEVEQTDWIHWFCKLEGNEYFVEIDEDFIKNESSTKKDVYKLHSIELGGNFGATTDCIFRTREEAVKSYQKRSEEIKEK